MLLGLWVLLLWVRREINQLILGGDRLHIV